MAYFRKLEGKKVYLSPIDIADAPRYAEWLNDLEVTKYLTLASASITVEKEHQVLAHLGTEHTYAIVDAATDELAGNIGLMDLDNLHRTAEVGLFIGDKAKWDRGFGTEALILMADYAFHVLGVGNLMLRAFDYNKRGIASYRKVGFKEIGRRRKARFWNGEYRDVVFMDLLAEDFGPTRLPALDVRGPDGV